MTYATQRSELKIVVSEITDEPQTDKPLMLSKCEPWDVVEISGGLGVHVCVPWSSIDGYEKERSEARWQFAACRWGHSLSKWFVEFYSHDKPIHRHIVQIIMPGMEGE